VLEEFKMWWKSVLCPSLCTLGKVFVLFGALGVVDSLAGTNLLSQAKQAFHRG
jgi:hypothetical protein